MFLNSIKKFLVDEEGVTATEYAILLTLIALVVAQAAMTLGLTANDAYETISAVLPN